MNRRVTLLVIGWLDPIDAHHQAEIASMLLFQVDDDRRSVSVSPIAKWPWSDTLATESTAAQTKAARESPDRSHQIVFWGDSITASGQYVAYFNAWLESTRPPEPPTIIIDCGSPRLGNRIGFE